MIAANPIQTLLTPKPLTSALTRPPTHRQTGGDALGSRKPGAANDSERGFRLEKPRKLLTEKADPQTKDATDPAAKAGSGDPTGIENSDEAARGGAALKAQDRPGMGAEQAEDSVTSAAVDSGRAPQGEAAPEADTASGEQVESPGPGGTAAHAATGENAKEDAAEAPLPMPEPGKPLTIRELNRVLRGLDRAGAPESLLADLGLSQAARSSSAFATTGTPARSNGTDPNATGMNAELLGSPAEADQPDAGGSTDPQDTSADGHAPQRQTASTMTSSTGLRAPAADQELTGAQVGTQQATDAAAAVDDATGEPAAGAGPRVTELPGLSRGSNLFRLERTAAAHTPQPAADAHEFQQQIARGLAAAVSLRGTSPTGSITLRLSPESLGPLKITVDVEGAAVSVRFSAASGEVARLIEQAMPALKESMAEQGLDLRDAETAIREPRSLADPAAAQGTRETTRHTDDSNASEHNRNHAGTGTPDGHAHHGGADGRNSANHSGSHGQGDRDAHKPAHDQADALDPHTFDAAEQLGIRSLDAVTLRVNALA